MNVNRKCGRVAPTTRERTMTAKTQRHIVAERWAKVASATSNQQRDYVVEAVSQMLKDREAADHAARETRTDH